MRVLVFTAAMIIAASTTLADTDNFDQAQVGSPPPNWTCGVTGKGSPVWKVEADQSAPSQPNVLKQSGSGTFPWCVKKDVSIKDGYAEVKFKPLEGREDEAGGVVWRWKDGDNYYVARANVKRLAKAVHIRLRGSVIRDTGNAVFRTHCPHEDQAAPPPLGEFHAEMVGDVQMRHGIEPQSRLK